MVIGSDRRKEVDDFLAAKKSLPAPGRWTEVNRVTEQRMRLPIEANGEVSPFEIEIIINPDAPEPSLTIVLLYGRCVWRLCLADEDHPNSFNRPDDLPAMISGPHCHSWADNRRFAHANQLPKKLKNARRLPRSVVTNDDAFSWFLNQIGVEYPNWGPPEWPTRTGLL